MKKPRLTRSERAGLCVLCMPCMVYGLLARLAWCPFDRMSGAQACGPNRATKASDACCFPVAFSDDEDDPDDSAGRRTTPEGLAVPVAWGVPVDDGDGTWFRSNRVAPLPL